MDMVRSMVGRTVQDALPSALSDALSRTPLAGIKDQVPWILETLQSGGLREHVQSWLRDGTNMRVSPEQLVSAIGEDRVREIARRLGIPEDQAMQLLSQYLPKAVDQGARDDERAQSER